ncbi:MAG TPA: sulfotransferase, partial [Acidimicrobiales bacterium]|nr:sulfotransferase [Acidimicrobiales bacterium]
LKAAIEQLLGAPCHHMFELMAHPEQIPTWHAAVRGEAVEWPTFLDDYGAIVDWPGAAFWRELVEAFPDAVVLLSTREPHAWYDSARSTIFPNLVNDIDEGADDQWKDWHAMVRDLFATRFTADIDDEAAAIAAFEAHYAAVRAEVPADRLLEWSVADGWGPLCEALGVDVPDEPFPRLNTREDWAPRTDRRGRTGRWADVGPDPLGGRGGP